MKKSLIAVGFWLLLLTRSAPAQELSPEFVKVGDGIYVYSVKRVEPDSNCGIIVTQEGVLLIDSGPNPPGSLIIQKAITQLAPQPVRYLINTETHADHTIGNFVFAPPATVIGSQGSVQGIKDYFDPKRNEKLMAESAEMREAFRGFRLVTPLRWIESAN